jgi:hypothetical protein
MPLKCLEQIAFQKFNSNYFLIKKKIQKKIQKI